MAAAPVGKSGRPLNKRSFFFALSADRKEFLFPGDKGRLLLRMLSLGFGARDEVHVLEAEGAQGEGENAKIVAQKTAMLAVQPSLPAVNLISTVLTPPVTFRLRSGPGPLYVSGSHLLFLEEFEKGATVKKKAQVSDEPAQKRARLSPGPHVEPLLTDAIQHFTGSLLYPNMADADDARAIAEARNASLSRKVPETASQKEQSKTFPEESGPNVAEHLDMIKEKVKAKIMESVAKGVKLSYDEIKFERFLMHCHKVTDQYLMHELWEWRKSLGV